MTLVGAPTAPARRRGSSSMACSGESTGTSQPVHPYGIHLAFIRHSSGIHSTCAPIRRARKSFPQPPWRAPTLPCTRFLLLTLYSTQLIYYTLLTQLLTTHHSLLTTHYLLITTHCPLLNVHCPLLTTHYSLLPAHYSQHTTHYLLTPHSSLLSPE